MPKSKRFQKLLESTKKYYTGKKVPEQYQKRYGKTYDEKEAESVAYSIAKKQGWKT